jgi:hypothetical protein
MIIMQFIYSFQIMADNKEYVLPSLNKRGKKGKGKSKPSWKKKQMIT